MIMQMAKRIFCAVPRGSECLLNYWANMKSRCCIEPGICFGRDTNIFGECRYDCFQGEYHDRDDLKCPVRGVMSI